MIQTVPFLKVSGAGNDFILISNMGGEYGIDWASFARAACSRPFGIGADGLLVLEESRRASFTMLYFNADGSSGSMCGNGGRCAARFAVETGIASSRHTFEACGHLYEAVAEGGGGRVTLRMKDVSSPPRAVMFPLDERSSVRGFTVDTGSPQVVVPVEDVSRADVETVGRMIRRHRLLEPGGANVNFVEEESGGMLKIRTYERGVESETMACGTGVVAAALTMASGKEAELPRPILVRSGEMLFVGFRQSDGVFTEITLTGSAHFLYKGKMKFNDSSGELSEPKVFESVNPV